MKKVQFKGEVSHSTGPSDWESNLLFMKVLGFEFGYCFIIYFLVVLPYFSLQIFKI